MTISSRAPRNWVSDILFRCLHLAMRRLRLLETMDAQDAVIWTRTGTRLPHPFADLVIHEATGPPELHITMEVKRGVYRMTSTESSASCQFPKNPRTPTSSALVRAALSMCLNLSGPIIKSLSSSSCRHQIIAGN